MLISLNLKNFILVFSLFSSRRIAVQSVLVFKCIRNIYFLKKRMRYIIISQISEAIELLDSLLPFV